MADAPNVGVILAAGRGHRMQLFSEQYPKPVLPIANRPLIAYQLERMRELGIKRVIVVIGHLGAEIVKTLDRIGPEFPDIEVTFHDQGELLGIAHAVGQLESKIDGPFALFLGDIYFVPNRLGALIEQFTRPEVKAVLSVRDNESAQSIQKNFAVFIDDNGYVTRVIEKPHHTRSHLKGCGVYLFDLEIFDAIRRTQRTALRDEYEITDSIQILIDDGYKVVASNNIRFDVNLTFPEDILRANLAQLTLSGGANSIAPGAQVAGVTLDHCIVGQGVSIAPGSRLRRSLILPDTRLETPVEADGLLASGAIRIQCPPEALDPLG